MNVYYVYEWYIKETGQVFYVGKGKGKRYKAYTHKTARFKYMLSNYDCDVRIVVDNMSEKEAYDEEIKRIAYYRSLPDNILINIADGGGGATGCLFTPQRRKQFSEKMKNKWETDEGFRNKILSARKDPNGPYKSEEFRKQISLLVSGEKNPNYGNRWTQDMKEHLSQKQKNNPRYRDAQNPNAKSVVCLETNEFFPCIKEAVIKYKINSPASISICLKSPYKTAGGLHWIESPEPLSDAECFEKYLQALGSYEKNFPIICCETKEIFMNQKFFVEYVNQYSSTRNTKEKLKSGGLFVNEKNYMYVKDYLKSRIAETL